MRNFDEKHPRVIENVGCRCKICKGSILKSQKRQDVDAIIHARQVEKYLQVQGKASCRYIGQEKSICNSEYQSLADTTAAKKASATANIKAVQIHQPSKEHLHKRINPGYRYIRHQKSKSFIAPPISITIPSKKEKTMQSSELESGLSDEAEQECIVFSFLEAVANFIVGPYS